MKEKKTKKKNMGLTSLKVHAEQFYRAFTVCMYDEESQIRLCISTPIEWMCICVEKTIKMLTE